jgi:hypothetical protein
MRAASLGVVALVIASGPAAARACSKRHQTPFELFELADTVATVTVNDVKTLPDAPRGQHLPDTLVDLRVQRVFKGSAPGGKLVARDTMYSSCRTMFRTGQTGLLFLGKDGFTVGVSEGFIRDSDPLARFPPFEKVIAAWASSPQPEARLALLVAVIAGGKDDGPASDAAQYLADEPALLVMIDRKQRAQLAAAVKSVSEYNALPLVLVRLRDPAAAKAASSHSVMIEKLLAIRQLESVTSTSKLAAVIEAGRDEHDARRIVALERCERLHRRKLESFTEYVGGRSNGGWAQLAEACRTGRPD